MSIFQVIYIRLHFGVDSAGEMPQRKRTEEMLKVLPNIFKIAKDILLVG